MTRPHDCVPTGRGVVPVSQVRDMSFHNSNVFPIHLAASDEELCFDPMSDSKLILFLKHQFLGRDGNFERISLFYFPASKSIFLKLGLICTTHKSVHIGKRKKWRRVFCYQIPDYTELYSI